MIILSIPFQKDIVVPAYYSGWKEYRLDYNSNPESFDNKLIDEQTIITIRDIQEGGINSFPIQKKINLYINYIKSDNCLVDLELENIQFAAKIPTENLILSWHCFTDDWNVDLLKQKIEQAISFKPRFVKIALNISAYSQFMQISEILKSYDYPIIFVGMGLLGKQSRLLYNQLNSKATYIGLENNPTASGQLSLPEAEMYNLFEHNPKTKIGGLIGSSQVYHSLGLTFYNEYFRQNNLNAVYLPLPVSHLDDFISWRDTLSNRDYGYSITMPFKTEMSKIINSDEPNINLYLPEKNVSFTTDKLALQKALLHLDIQKENNILIYGSGATAEMALQVLTSYPNVCVESRNKNALNKLNSHYNRHPLLDTIKFDLVINCTPLGMKEENFIKATNLHLEGKFIDLPYSTNRTPLIQSCLTNKFNFVDGKMFWEWQAEKQLEEFSNAIDK